MNKNEMYALHYPTTQSLSKKALDFFETKQELEDKITELSKQLNLTNQSFLEFSRVYPKGAVLNGSSYEDFRQSKKENTLRKNNMIGGYVVQKTLKNGKEKLKVYDFEEDFGWQLSEWTKKGVTNVVILDENTSYGAEYYWKRDMKKVWNDKEVLFS